MNGAEHYYEAERLLDSVAELTANASPLDLAQPSVIAAVDALHASAQVHASLALAFPGLVNQFVAQSAR